jgi:GAF domain-containing protein
LFLTVSQTSQKLIVQHSVGYKNLPANTYIDINKDPLLGKLYKEPSTKIFHRDDWTKEYINLPYTANALIVSPITLGKKAIGFIILGDKSNGRGFSMNNQILLGAIATQIAPALEEQRLLTLQASAEDLKRVYIDPFYSN